MIIFESILKWFNKQPVATWLKARIFNEVCELQSFENCNSKIELIGFANTLVGFDNCAIQKGQFFIFLQLLVIITCLNYFSIYHSEFIL